MDGADLEMVEHSRGRDDVVAAEDLREEGHVMMDIVDNPYVRRQNYCFLLAMVSLIGFGIYMAARPGQAVVWVGRKGDDDGISQMDNTEKAAQVMETYKDKYSASHGKGWSKNHPGDPEKSSLQTWLDANVTLDDGIQYEIVSRLRHDKNAFTEGLCFADGRLFESVGLVGKSDLRELDPQTGDVINTYPRPGVFAEGLTYAHGNLIQLTYKSQKGYVYKLSDLSATPDEFGFDSTTHEGWGLTYDPQQDELIMSDGSAYLHFWDPQTMKEIRKVKVTRLNGDDATQINELEFWRGRVLANIWYMDIIIVIDPKTGRVEKEYDFSKLWEQSDRYNQGADVLNGISISENPDNLYITGKNWDRMFAVR